MMNILGFMDVLDGAHLVRVFQKDSETCMVYVWRGGLTVEVVQVYADGTAQDIISLRLPEASRVAAEDVIFYDFHVHVKKASGTSS